MRYEIKHRTTYSYDDPVSIAHHLARLAPRDLPHQHLRGEVVRRVRKYLVDVLFECIVDFERVADARLRADPGGVGELRRIAAAEL